MKLSIGIWFDIRYCGVKVLPRYGLTELRMVKSEKKRQSVDIISDLREQTRKKDSSGRGVRRFHPGCCKIGW